MSLWFWFQRLRAGNDRGRLRQLVSGQERAPQAIRLSAPQRPGQSLPDVQERPLGCAPGQKTMVKMQWGGEGNSDSGDEL
jgi:hypothetical protein